MPQPDLDAYFQRIGHPADMREPTLETLRALHLEHAQAIAFENLNPFSGRPVKLDLASLERKLVHQRRGGYCFEQNLLFSHVLQQLGYRVTGLGARVVWNAPEGTIGKRSHMLLLVEIGGERYIADVGFGGLTLTAPLRLVTDVVQPTPHEPFRLIQYGGDLLLQTQLHDTWKQIYRFDLQPQYLVDYEVASWYVSNHPRSRFVTSLIAARPAPGRRYALADNTLTVHELGGPSTRHTLQDAAELRAALETHFGLHLSAADADIAAALGRAINPSATP